jgi:2-methylcitrate dehydratase PrpD
MFIQEQSIITALASFAHGTTYSDLPDGVRELSKTRILDGLSAAYDGRNLPHSRVALGLAKDNPGDFTVIGEKTKAALQDAVLANSVLTHSCAREDFLGRSHPVTFVVPVALALGEKERAKGKEILTAIVVGYELTERIARGINPLSNSAFRPGPVVGTFGAAATAGKLMKLDTISLSTCLSYSANFTLGPPNEWLWAGTMEGVFEAGVCARNGMLSADLAKLGATASPRVIEGKNGFLDCWAGTTERAHLITEGLGESFAITKATDKLYPVCALNQGLIQTAQKLIKSGIDAKDIVRIVERTGIGTTSYPGSNSTGPFTGYFNAIMSMQFSIAATILGRPVGTTALYAEHFHDSEIAELAAKTELVEEDGRTRISLEVYTENGKVFTVEEDPISLEAFIPSRTKSEDTFMKLASPYLGEKTAHSVIELVMNLDRMDDIHELTATL